MKNTSYFHSEDQIENSKFLSKEKIRLFAGNSDNYKVNLWK